MPSTADSPSSPTKEMGEGADNFHEKEGRLVRTKSEKGDKSFRRQNSRGKDKDSAHKYKRTHSSVTKSKSGECEAEIEMLTPKQNGAVLQDHEDDETKRSQSSAIKGMWKKAFKNLKSNEKQNWLTKKGSLIKRKDSKDQEEPEEEICKEIDPVYSLLKCAADLPKASKSACSVSSKHGSHDSSGNTSKTSSPSSSGEGQGDLLKPETVAQGLGSDFKQFYKLTSPAKKSSSVLDSFF